MSNVSKIRISIIQWAFCGVHCALLPYISDYKGNIPVKKDNLLKVFSDWGPDFHIMFDVQITSDDWDSSDIGLRNVLQFTRSGHFLMFYFRFYWLALQKLFEKTPLLFSSLLKTSLFKHWTSCATSITLQASCFEIDFLVSRGSWTLLEAFCEPSVTWTSRIRTTKSNLD